MKKRSAIVLGFVFLLSSLLSVPSFAVEKVMFLKIPEMY